MPRATTRDGRRWMAGDRVHQSYNKSISSPVFVTIAFPLRIVMMYEYYVRIINIYAALLIIRLYII